MSFPRMREAVHPSNDMGCQMRHSGCTQSLACCRSSLVNSHYTTQNKAPQWTGQDSNLRRLTPMGLQPIPFSLSGTCPVPSDRPKGSQAYLLDLKGPRLSTSPCEFLHICSGRLCDFALVRLRTAFASLRMHGFPIPWRGRDGVGRIRGTEAVDLSSLALLGQMNPAWNRVHRASAIAGSGDTGP
jgi:hypothetical protein